MPPVAASGAAPYWLMVRWFYRLMVRPLHRLMAALHLLMARCPTC